MKQMYLTRLASKPLILPKDAALQPVRRLRRSLQIKLGCSKEDVILCRPGARAPTKLLDSETAKLLQLFRKPRTIADAVRDYSAAQGVDPQFALRGAFSALYPLIRAGLLLPAQSGEAGRLTPSFKIREKLGPYQCVQSLSVMEDTEVYKVWCSDKHLHYALKISRPNQLYSKASLVRHEAAVLRHLDGVASPRLIESDSFQGRPYIVTEWCNGLSATARAAALRRGRGHRTRVGLLDLCTSILTAYAHLHNQKVVHSDVHPRNVIIQSDGSTKIVDYTYSQFLDSKSRIEKVPRAGIAYYFEPEYARAVLAGRYPPAASFSGEQYSLAALMYQLLTGTQYLDFSLSRRDVLYAIANSIPVSFKQRGIASWPAAEKTLCRALSKSPRSRFASVFRLLQNFQELRSSAS
jgi:hypothetical protein